LLQGRFIRKSLAWQGLRWTKH